MNQNNNLSKSFSTFRNDISSTIDAGFKKMIVQYKIILVGDSAVGKTSLLNQYVHNKFKSKVETTIAVGSKKRLYNLNQKTVAELEVFDTCGEEKFRSIVRSYFQGKHGAVMVYDITNKSSFEGLDSWLKEINEAAPKNIKIILVGNKSDRDDKRQISREAGQKYAKKHDMDFIEVSAKTGSSVSLIFEKLATGIFKTKEEKKEENDKDDVQEIQSVKLHSNILNYNSKDEGSVKNPEKTKCC
jgi:small GTP-binding protein